MPQGASRPFMRAYGVARPLSIYIDTHGTGKVSEDKLEKAVAEVMDLTRAAPATSALGIRPSCGVPSIETCCAASRRAGVNVT